MNCQDFEKSVLALARNQLLDALVRAESLAHAEACARCAARLAEERALLDGVRLVVAELAREEAPVRVEAALLVAFREQAGRKATPNVRPLPERRRQRQWTIGLAWAAVVLLAVLAGVGWLKFGSVGQKQEARQQPARPESHTAQKEPPVANVSGQKPAATQHAKTRRARRQAAAPESELATQFYPLVEAGELAPLESGRVVRVEVPVSTLITLGLPVTAESLNQSIQADLLLGQDGLARAIRFSPEGLTSPQSQTKTQ